MCRVYISKITSGGVKCSARKSSIVASTPTNKIPGVDRRTMYNYGKSGHLQTYCKRPFKNIQESKNVSVACKHREKKCCVCHTFDTHNDDECKTKHPSLASSTQQKAEQAENASIDYGFSSTGDRE